MAAIATSFPEPRDLTAGSDRERIAAVVARCIEGTTEALRRCGAANDRELADATRVAEDRARDGQPVDLLEVVARLQGADEEHMGPAMSRLSAAVASTMLPAPPLIPFAGKLIAPSAFYESFQQILALGRALLAPVLFAEDTDAIGTGSVNPLAARLLADEIHAGVERRFGIRPFMTITRLDYESWSFLTRKHFGV
jgi:hypothetical protein